MRVVSGEQTDSMVSFLKKQVGGRWVEWGSGRCGGVGGERWMVGAVMGGRILYGVVIVVLVEGLLMWGEWAELMLREWVGVLMLRLWC